MSCTKRGCVVSYPCVGARNTMPCPGLFRQSQGTSVISDSTLKSHAVKCQGKQHLRVTGTWETRESKRHIDEFSRAINFSVIQQTTQTSKMNAVSRNASSQLFSERFKIEQVRLGHLLLS